MDYSGERVETERMQTTEYNVVDVNVAHVATVLE